ncbi:progranulin isoform X2 [Ambystoma mexicanum]
MWSSLVLCLSLAGLGTAVQCPDGQICFQGTSCCQLPGGRYGCCPFLLEIRDSLRMIQTGSLNDISGSFCPNKATCPSEYSCLETHTGSYSCCPFVEAVSCYDGRHCCPRGFRCSNDGRSCLQHSESSEANAIVCPDGESECPNESTCCEMQDHSWGCCPMPKAICCDDKVHCCPHSTSCDVAHGKCTSAEGEEPMWTKFSARKRAAWEKGSEATTERVTCHDGSTCPNGNTCCILPDQKYGCCPIVDAVCCVDHVHCCPPRTECDLIRSKCNSEAGSSPLLIKTPALESLVMKPWSLKEIVQDVQCNDTTTCPDGETCCRLASGEWGCCPLEKAVCCNDHVHCCPSGTTCDTEHGLCNGNGPSVPWSIKTQAKESTMFRGLQCDETTQCNVGDTCCKTASGGWACCPLPQAVCCADKVHCCPSGYTCNVEEGTCLQGLQEIPWLAKSPAQFLMETGSQSVKCDEETSCKVEETCCKDPGGDWACCPVPRAVCCDDHLHCCPTGYTCNVEEQTCAQGLHAMPWFTKVTAHIEEMAPRGKAVACDDTASCPDGSTCCKTVSGGWACCPLLNAVCCSDHVHCCPSDYTCDIEQGTCSQGNNLVALFTKTPAIVTELHRSLEIRCDDSTSCADGNTCCKTTTGEWGCCPMLQAVCCTDHIHCCPNGYTCDVEKETCDQGEQSIPWLTKIASIVEVTAKRSKDVQCDDTSSCEDGNTCCKTSSGGWACCPLPNAVCCSDHVHCCPNGYTCDVEQGSCHQGHESTPWLIKTPADKKVVQRSKDVQCDGKSSCPDGNTCCKRDSGDWGCCPLEKAVCCADHEHCCPSEYTCNISEGTCIKGDEFIPWLTKETARGVDVQSREVPCDESHFCKDGTTCCKTNTGSWSCCPLPQAVCCSDHIHCCPNGYTCNVEEGTCVMGSRSVSWHSKNPANIKNEVPLRGETSCDETSSCPKESTCCRLASSEWACCPLLQAVCCTDGFHCCPSGYRCAGESCVLEQTLRWDNNFFGNKKLKIL